jgi:hypothetical protein
MNPPSENVRKVRDGIWKRPKSLKIEIERGNKNEDSERWNSVLGYGIESLNEFVTFAKKGRSTVKGKCADDAKYLTRIWKFLMKT